MKISNTTGAVYGSPETSKKTVVAEKFETIAVDSQDNSLNADSYKNDTKVIKKSIAFDGAFAKISFRDINRSGIIEFNLSMEAFEKLKDTFGDSIVKKNENTYIANSNAEKYLAASYELFKHNMPDLDQDGKINFEEFKNSNKAILAYDNSQNMPVLGKLKDYVTDEDIVKYEKFSKDDAKSLDEMFCKEILIDKNIDGIIQKAEAENAITNPYGNLQTLKELLLTMDSFEDIDDEEKKKIYAKAIGMDINVLKSLARDVDLFKTNTSPLAHLLSNLRDSVQDKS